MINHYCACGIYYLVYTGPIKWAGTTPHVTTRFILLCRAGPYRAGPSPLPKLGQHGTRTLFGWCDIKIGVPDTLDCSRLPGRRILPALSIDTDAKRFLPPPFCSNTQPTSRIIMIMVCKRGPCCIVSCFAAPCHVSVNTVYLT